jgi:hypothetical protein
VVDVGDDGDIANAHKDFLMVVLPQGEVNDESGGRLKLLLPGVAEGVVDGVERCGEIDWSCGGHFFS